MKAVSSTKALWLRHHSKGPPALPLALAFASGNNPWIIKTTLHYSKDSNEGRGPPGDEGDAKEKLKSLLSSLRTPAPFQDRPDGKSEEGPKLAKPNFRPRKAPGDQGTAQHRKESDIDPGLAHSARRVAKAAADATFPKEGSSPENGRHLGQELEDAKQLKAAKVESDLLKKLKAVVSSSGSDEEGASAKGGTDQLASMFGSLKIEKSFEEDKRGDFEQRRRPRAMTDVDSSKQKELTQEQMAFLERRRKLRREDRAKAMEEAQLRHEPVDLFNSQPPLGFFVTDPDTAGRDSPSPPRLEVWEACKRRDLKILSRLPPRNFLEEMALMTERGVLWQFPVDNEQGVDEAQMEPFHEHVFLERHLEPWCPGRGPLRHFMELVCVALSKNPHITAGKKVETILWYRDYFEKPEHNDILRVSGAYSA